MELYNKMTLKTLTNHHQEEFYMPKSLFKGYKSLRLETQLVEVNKQDLFVYDLES